MRQCPGISGISSSDFRSGYSGAAGDVRPATRARDAHRSRIPAESPANKDNSRVRRNNRVASRRQLQVTRTNFLAYPQPPS
ncbi:hypothetical protein BSLA_02r4771 [Burkholderia stabilis]|nr:hypothetical protein BSLA_02r4771 [Burkholderia stabilis]